jgi:putative transposase
MGKRHKPEEIIGKLREAEIVLAQGGTTADACRRIAVTEQPIIVGARSMGV